MLVPICGLDHAFPNSGPSLTLLKSGVLLVLVNTSFPFVEAVGFHFPKSEARLLLAEPFAIDEPPTKDLMREPARELLMPFPTHNAKGRYVGRQAQIIAKAGSMMTKR